MVAWTDIWGSSVGIKSAVGGVGREGEEEIAIPRLQTLMTRNLAVSLSDRGEESELSGGELQFC